MASSFIGRIAVKSKSIGTTRRKIERNEMNEIVLYPTFRIRFELLKKMQEREIIPWMSEKPLKLCKKIVQTFFYLHISIVLHEFLKY
mgnify:CR=1 FL=1